MNEGVHVVVVSQELIADLSGTLSDGCCVIKDSFPCRISRDFMNDQDVRHAHSNCRLSEWR